MLNKRKKIGLIGCGAIGNDIALFIEEKLKNEAYLYAICDKDIKAVEKLTALLGFTPKILDIDTLIKDVDLVIEAASIEAAQLILKKILIYKKDTVVVSVGALVKSFSILKEIRKNKINLYVSSGAICGVDGLGALSMGNIKSITLTTLKPPQGLMGADYLKKNKINLENLKKDKIVFSGTVDEAIKYFPKNINIAATIFLASSFDNVNVCIKADPGVKRNIHRIVVDAEEAKISIDIENVPSKSNPKTSALTSLSTKFLLLKIFSSFKVGG